MTTSATNYLVVVGLDDPGAPLTNGDLGTVTIVTKRVADVLSVPTSAVTAIGTRHLVQVLGSGGTPKTVSVRVGAIGSTWTQVTSGLRAGDTVVVADLSTPLPGSATSSTNGTTGTNGTAASRIQSLFRGAGAGGGFGGGGLRRWRRSLIGPAGPVSCDRGVRVGEPCTPISRRAARTGRSTGARRRGGRVRSRTPRPSR